MERPGCGRGLGGLEAVFKGFPCWVSDTGWGFSVCFLVLFVAFSSSCVLCVCLGFPYDLAFCRRALWEEAREWKRGGVGGVQRKTSRVFGAQDKW